MIIKALILTYLFFGFLCFLASTLEQRRIWHCAVALAFLGAALHLFEVLKRGLVAGRLPFTNTYETLLLLGLLMMCLYFFALKRYQAAVIGGFVGIIAAMVLALSCLLSNEIEPLLPSLKSNWLLFHVGSAFIGYASFAVASASGALFLCASRWPGRFLGKEKAVRREAFLGQLHELTQRFVSMGFPFLTMGIATGAIWANATWGRYWNWDPKETWAFITWLCYAVCLHMQREGKAGPPKIAWVTVASFATVLFTYFGVNFWFASLHAAYA